MSLGSEARQTDHLPRLVVFGLERNRDPNARPVRSHGNARTSQRLVLPPLTMAERPDQGTDPSALGSGENGKLCDIRSAAREPAVLLALASQTRDETQRSEDHPADDGVPARVRVRSEEHTSELQSLAYLVCRLLLEKKNQSLTGDSHVVHAGSAS